MLDNVDQIWVRYSEEDTEVYVCESHAPIDELIDVTLDGSDIEDDTTVNDLDFFEAIIIYQDGSLKKYSKEDLSLELNNMIDQIYQERQE